MSGVRSWQGELLSSLGFALAFPLSAQDLLQEELSTASTSLEAQQKHAVELKKELAKPPGRSFYMFLLLPESISLPQGCILSWTC